MFLLGNWGSPLWEWIGAAQAPSGLETCALFSPWTPCNLQRHFGVLLMIRDYPNHLLACSVYGVQTSTSPNTSAKDSLGSDLIVAVSWAIPGTSSAWYGPFWPGTSIFAIWRCFLGIELANQRYTNSIQQHDFPITWLFPNLYDPNQSCSHI